VDPEISKQKVEALQKGGGLHDIAKNSHILGLKCRVLLTFYDKFRVKGGEGVALNPPIEISTLPCGVFDELTNLREL
jgi:hypothetical protein